MVISDSHRGLTNAVNAVNAGSGWQRCRVHCMRNALARVGKGGAEMFAATIRTVFAQPTADTVRAHVDTVADMLRPQFPAVADLLLDAKEDLTAFADFPHAHWRKIWSTNPLERLNKEVGQTPNRRRRVGAPPLAGDFPNTDALLRLSACVMIEAHDEYQDTDRRYLSEESMALLNPPAPTLLKPPTLTSGQALAPAAVATA